MERRTPNTNNYNCAVCLHNLYSFFFFGHICSTASSLWKALESYIGPIMHWHTLQTGTDWIKRDYVIKEYNMSRSDRCRTFDSIFSLVHPHMKSFMRLKKKRIETHFNFDTIFFLLSYQFNRITSSFQRELVGSIITIDVINGMLAVMDERDRWMEIIFD